MDVFTCFADILPVTSVEGSAETASVPIDEESTGGGANYYCVIA